MPAPYMPIHAHVFPCIICAHACPLCSFDQTNVCNVEWGGANFKGATGLPRKQRYACDVRSDIGQWTCISGMAKSGLCNNVRESQDIPGEMD